MRPEAATPDSEQTQEMQPRPVRDSEGTFVYPPDYTPPMPQDGVLVMMRRDPGSLMSLVIEWAGVVLVVVGLLTIVFLLCVGGYALVHVIPG